VNGIRAATLLSGAVDLRLLQGRGRAMRRENVTGGVFDTHHTIRAARRADCFCETERWRGAHLTPSEPTIAPTIEPAIQPPWKVLPWPEHSAEPQRIKIEIAQPDILVKGLLIDLFV
jgi:hypothetical protein